MGPPHFSSANLTNGERWELMILTHAYSHEHTRTHIHTLRSTKSSSNKHCESSLIRLEKVLSGATDMKACNIKHQQQEVLTEHCAGPWPHWHPIGRHICPPAMRSLTAHWVLNDVARCGGTWLHKALILQTRYTLWDSVDCFFSLIVAQKWTCS